MLGLGNAITLQFTAGSGVIPSLAKAHFWLDGNRTGENFLDRQEGKLFPIVGRDWDDSFIGFPYKSTATISAPTGDATLFAADINSFWYGVDADSPNDIPIVSFFQNIDYEDKGFARHVPQTLDGNGAEVTEPYVKDIALYNAALVGDELSAANTYYNVPTKETSNVIWIAKDGNDTTGDGSEGNPYLTFEKGDLEASANDTIYVKTGVYKYNSDSRAYLRLDKGYNLIGLGRVKGDSNGDATRIIQIQVSGNLVKGLWLAPSTEAQSVSFGTDSTFQLCRLESGSSAVSSITNTGTQGVFQYSTLIGGRLLVASASIKYDTCHITQDSIANNMFFTSAADDLTVHNNKVVVTNAANIIVSGGASAFSFKGNNWTISNDVTSFFAYSTAPSSFVFTDNICDTDADFSSASGLFNIDDVPTVSILRNKLTINETTIDAYVFFVQNATTLNYEYNNIKTLATGGLIHLLVTVDDAGKPTTTCSILNNRAVSSGNTDFLHRIGTDGSSAYDDLISGIVIKNNYVENTLETANNAFFVGFNKDAIIMYNKCVRWIHGITNKHSLASASAAVIAYNILEGCQILTFGAESVKVYGNTIYMNDIADNVCVNVGENGGVDPENCMVRNNLVYALNNAQTYRLLALVVSTGLESDYNVFFQVGGSAIFSLDSVDKTFAELQAAGFDTNSLNDQDPLLNSEFVPQLGSPALGAGETLDPAYDDGLDALTVWGDEDTVPSVTTKQQTAPWDAGAYVS